MSDFVQHTLLYLLTLGVVCAGAALHAPAEVLSPLSMGLGAALPALLGAHGAAAALSSWKEGQAAVEEAKR